MPALLLLAFVVGLVLPVQAGLNAQLRVALGSPLGASLVSFVVGTVGLLALVVMARSPLPIGTAWARSNWWQWGGGLLGALYIGAAVVLAPRLGAATLIATVVAGQMVASLVLDQFGLLGFASHPITPMRLAGAVLVMVGVAIIQR
ncbi:MAG: DMT family transporter [Gemmatimonadota bacterium]